MTAGYNWTPLRTIRVSTRANPNLVTNQFPVEVPEGIGDLCHDGRNLWVLANLHDGVDDPSATIYVVDPATGEGVARLDDFHRCEAGRPAGLACDGGVGRAWLFCFNEERGEPGSLAEFSFR